MLVGVLGLGVRPNSWPANGRMERYPGISLTLTHSLTHSLSLTDSWLQEWIIDEVVVFILFQLCYSTQS